MIFSSAVFCFILLLVSAFSSCLVQAQIPSPASQFIVDDLPNANTTSLGRHYAGLLPSGPTAKYFFWYIPASDTATSDQAETLVVWLQGGPGCSSMAGGLLENGPLLIQSDGTLSSNPFSWHKQANILYGEPELFGLLFYGFLTGGSLTVEQPIGTGFSVVPEGSETTQAPFNEKDVSESFYTFMDNFMGVFKDLRKYKLYITGESYAGIYIPHISQHLLALKNWTNGMPILLSGIALGNPLLDPPFQLSPSAAINDFDFFNDSGFFSKPHAAAILYEAATLAEQCRNSTIDEAFNLTASCSITQLLQTWYSTNSKINNNTCFDPYNIHFDIPCDNSFMNRHWKQETALETYLNTAAVQKALHIPQSVTGKSATWQLCNSMIPLDDSMIAPSNELFGLLVASGVKILVFEGASDAIVNYVAIERLFGNTTWAGETGFKQQPTDWNVGSNRVGKIWKERGLTYIRVNGVGHMVPADSPETGSSILSELLKENELWEKNSTPNGVNLVSNKSIESLIAFPWYFAVLFLWW
ncbi:Alpha/Beta hydrolase protein [Obelidium mucronatum]|nr:Alpha/Beta hydrolase protein [Obelidium mucronatum]